MRERTSERERIDGKSTANFATFSEDNFSNVEDGETIEQAAHSQAPSNGSTRSDF